jgi:Ran GTPase-activating protein (RanGAP) involved in mRNA processing and transport/signal recognition particle receptor subunit beta
MDEAYQPNVIYKIEPEELEGLFARARDEKWTDLVLIAPHIKLDPLSEDWPQSLQGHTAFQLKRVFHIPSSWFDALIDLKHMTLWGIEIGNSTIINLTGLISLQLWSNNLGADETNAIASNLKQIRSLDLAGNNIGAEGAKAIATNLKQLTSLNLWGNEVRKTGVKAIARNLLQLISLNLSDNMVGDEGAKSIAGNLSQLTELSLGNNSIGVEGATAIASKLSKLTILDLWGNNLGNEGVKVIASDLEQLKSLELWGNKIGKEGANAIANSLKHLTSLSLGRNNIGDEGAKSVAANLTKLVSLDLGQNKIGNEGAKAIASDLIQLRSLGLWYNKIGVDGTKSITNNLKHLTSLGLSGNKIGDQGARAIASNLGNLVSLSLDNNQIGNDGLKAIAKNLHHLKTLSLSENKGITSLEALSQLTSLRRLDLSVTSITDLSPLRFLFESGIPLHWERHWGGNGIGVRDCPLVHPTPEIIQQGHEAVLNYFREIDRQGVDYIYEAKVLLVGEGGAGKTSLIRRLYYPNMPLPQEDESTKGIDIHTQKFTRTNGGDFRLNVWDFGGQQIYHSTHQFFLTKNSLYILVDDTRQNHNSVRDKEFKYWLEALEAFGDKSPVLIFQNEKGGRSKKIDEAGIKGRFPNVLDTHRGDLDLKNAADGLHRAIEHFVQKLPHVGEEVPKKWVSIRADIEKAALTKPYISRDEYFEIYKRHLEFDRTKALYLSRYLHDLGVFLHFQEDLQLHKTVILQNRWATEAVFRILDDETVKGRLGYFTLEDCGRLWASTEYADMHLELLALMEKFELCYRLVDKKPDTWLVPQLLCPSTPKYVESWAAPGDLVLVYRYEFLPRGLISRLMVRMHRFALHPDRSWLNGAMFEYQENALLAHATDRGDEIVLRAKGPENKALLSVIAGELDALNGSFSGLKDKVMKWIPCICGKCRAVATPELFEEKRLLQRRRDGKLAIECPTSYEDVGVLELLDGLRLEQIPNWGRAVQPSTVKTIKIFLASSEELRKDRDDFDLYFRQQNDLLHKRGLYLEIVRWENFLDAMSETRLQDEYNKAVRNADIFVSLFMTKTGKYTEEEFDVALQAFKDTGKPIIYTFFKEAQVTTDAKGLAALTTLVKFQEKLQSLGHFYTKYKSPEHLRQLFRDQLDKLEDEGSI